MLPLYAGICAILSAIRRRKFMHRIFTAQVHDPLHYHLPSSLPLQPAHAMRVLFGLGRTPFIHRHPNRVYQKQFRLMSWPG